MEEESVVLSVHVVTSIQGSGTVCTLLNSLKVHLHRYLGTLSKYRWKSLLIFKKILLKAAVFREVFWFVGPLSPPVGLVYIVVMALHAGAAPHPPAAASQTQ